MHETNCRTLSQVRSTHRQFLVARSGWTIPLSERNFMAYAIWRAKFTLCCMVIGCDVCSVKSVQCEECAVWRVYSVESRGRR